MEIEKKLPPNIESYLQNNNYNAPINVSNNQELIYKVIASTGLNYESAKIIIEYIFEEIRNQIFNNKIVIIKKLGKFLISSPINGTKKKIFIKFKPYKELMRKLNE